MDYLFLLGRILFGGFFLISGFGHLSGASQMAQYAAAKRVPSPRLAVVASGLLIMGGGLSMLLGMYPRVGVLLLALFLVPVTLRMHDFWTQTDAQARQLDQVMFMKNLALLGAALMLLLVPQPWPLSLGR